jgi:hypothetical protein
MESVKASKVLTDLLSSRESPGFIHNPKSANVKVSKNGN